MTSPKTPLRTPIRDSILGLRPSAQAVVFGERLGDPSVIPLWFGESDLTTPDVVRKACIEALEAGKTRYVSPPGIRPLRQAIVDYTNRLFGTQIGLDRVTVPGSAMLAITMAVQCLAQPGDGVVIVTPQWTNIILTAEAQGADVRLVSQRFETGADGRPHWRLDFDALFAACDARTKAIFIGSPANPTGWMMDAEDQARVLAFARERNIAIIADEVYARLVYDRPVAPSFVSIAEPDDPVFIINSFSKTWAMTGWRLGWMLAPRYLADRLDTLSLVTNTGAASFTQYGAMAALEEGEGFIATMVEHCRSGLSVVEEVLEGHNRIRMARPQGAFYAYLEIDGLKDSVAFGQALLAEENVGVAPGAAFGPDNEAFIRICFAQGQERLAEALDRLTRFVSRM